MAVDVKDLYTRYGPLVLRRCRTLLRREEEAVDAMQDVFVRVLVHKSRLDERGCSSLLYCIATNVCLNRLRSQRRRPEDPQSELLFQIAAAGGQEGATEARSLLDRLLSREPESSAVIAVLHLHDGMTLEEVASEVGLSVSGVRKRLRRLQEGLAALQAQDEAGPQRAKDARRAPASDPKEGR
ncbi:MAG: sigma-70 family RNA polymerase sigma factor [Myxococcales bacterium]|nr:sigma-70 family RNA polymerase sigma factor [Myxococcales bacterium]